ncbi:hypothetical protein [Nocardia jiangxiensis]|uniref:hypothetical protein n=1 Tax=Nocardia jiangxiensis TaxID=282685 RepID=UPI0012F67FC1|nr:hypothetical protein [Nocardia jiangxiensis]
MSVWEIILWAAAAVVALSFATFFAAVGLVVWALSDIVRTEQRTAAKFTAAWNPETKTFDGLEFRDGEWQEVIR